MRVLSTLVRKELMALLLSPAAWITLTLFLLLQGANLYLVVQVAAQPGGPEVEPLELLFGRTLLFWIMGLLLATTSTMGLLAGERRQGTLELLLTCPVSPAQVVLAKYLAALSFYLAVFATSAFHVALGARLLGPPDPGALLSSYLGVALLGAGWVAVGLLASALTRSQSAAAVMTFSALAALLVLGDLAGAAGGHPGLAAALWHVNAFAHMEELCQGVLELRRVTYHLGLAAFALTAAVLAVRRPGAGAR